MSLIDRFVIGFAEQFEEIIVSIAEPDRDGFYLASEDDTQELEGYLQEISQKSGSTLTHISMMLAVAGLFFDPRDSHIFELIVLTLEMVAYLFLAMACLTVFYFHDTSFSKEDPANVRRGNDRCSEVLRRAIRTSIVQNFASRWTLFVTFCFSISVVAHIFL